MNWKSKLLISAIAWGVLTSHSVAAGLNAWAGPLEIDNVRPWANGYLYVTFTTSTGITSCAAHTQAVIDMNTLGEARQEMSAVLLSALLSGKKVWIYASQCTISRPELDAVRIDS